MLEIYSSYGEGDSAYLDYPNRFLLALIDREEAALDFLRDVKGVVAAMAVTFIHKLIVK